MPSTFTYGRTFACIFLGTLESLCSLCPGRNSTTPNQLNKLDQDAVVVTWRKACCQFNGWPLFADLKLFKIFSCGWNSVKLLLCRLICCFKHMKSVLFHTQTTTNGSTVSYNTYYSLLVYNFSLNWLKLVFKWIVSLSFIAPINFDRN